ncbi:MAG: transcriptional regulator [Flaviaesturariibacter sp.]|nr:transcriptional regulator [Flaviaesturariibacter sp.]
MSDFRLEVFYTVARRLSFTKAAAELFISQPAVTKHVHELEDQYGTKLFERSGNQVRLTAAGRLLLQHAEEVFAVYRSLEAKMASLNHREQGLLRLGASTTIAQYVIPPLLAGFRQAYGNVSVQLINGNTEQIETALLKKEIELGIIEGRSKKPAIKYLPFLKDSLLLVSRSHPNVQGGLTPQELTTLPLLLREPGSGTLEVIEHALKQHKIRLSGLTIEMQLGSTESIKSYLQYSDCVAFLSSHSIQRELAAGDLQIIPLKGLAIERWFYLIHLQGKAEALPELFMRFAKEGYNEK